jgi:hypothetical protein
VMWWKCWINAPNSLSLPLKILECVSHSFWKSPQWTDWALFIHSGNRIISILFGFFFPSPSSLSSPPNLCLLPSPLRDICTLILNSFVLSWGKTTVPSHTILIPIPEAITSTTFLFYQKSIAYSFTYLHIYIS